MNDRFKFRVWDKKSNNYIKEKIFYIDKFGELFKYEKSKSTVYINAQSPYVMCLCGNNYIVEQCTGLKDKNGKLIYEGDIVKKEFKNKPFSSKAKTKEKLIKIKWNDIEACFSFDFLNEKDKHDDFQCWENSWEHEYSNDELIGNIHENKDLLGE